MNLKLSDERSLKMVEQTQTDDQKSGIIILECDHCNSSGECRAAKTTSIEHSCEYCKKKSGIQLTNPFAIVPCGYCGGMGKKIIDRKIQQPKQQRKNNQNGGQSHGR